VFDKAIIKEYATLMGETLSRVAAALRFKNHTDTERRRYPSPFLLPPQADEQKRQAFRLAIAASGALVIARVPGWLAAFDTEGPKLINTAIQNFANQQRDRFWDKYTGLHKDAKPQAVMNLNLTTLDGTDHSLEIKQKINGTTNGDTESITFNNELIEKDGKKSLVVHKLARDFDGTDWYCSAKKFVDGKERQDTHSNYPFYLSTNPNDSTLQSGNGGLLTDNVLGMVVNFIKEDMTLFLRAVLVPAAFHQPNPSSSSK